MRWSAVANWTRSQGFWMPDARREGSRGLYLIDVLAMQIRGTARMENRSTGKGTVETVTLPSRLSEADRAGAVRQAKASASQAWQRRKL